MFSGDLEKTFFFDLDEIGLRNRLLAVRASCGKSGSPGAPRK